MATISNTPRPGYAYDSTGDVWYPIGTGPHTHGDYITQATAINPTIVDAKGDIIAASAADTVARLAVGANDTVLTADSSTATGLKWATPAAGGRTLISTTSLTGASVTLSSIPQTYKSLSLQIYGVTNATADGNFVVNANNATNAIWTASRRGVTSTFSSAGDLVLSSNNPPLRTDANNVWSLIFDNYTSTTNYKSLNWYGVSFDAGSANCSVTGGGGFISNTAITSIVIKNLGGNLSTGTVELYGVN